MGYHASALAEPLDEWVAKNIVAEDAVLCQLAINDEYFFIARSGNKVKVGSRLDLSNYRGRIHSFSVSWIMRNEHGTYLSTKVPPVRIKDDYSQQSSHLFAESIQYQSLNFSNSREMSVQVKVTKCDGQTCTQQNAQDFSVNLCKVELPR